MSGFIPLNARSLTFAAQALRIAKCLPRDPIGKHIADQLFRSGTSVGANVFEAGAGESRADFLHKMQIALKESREAHLACTTARSQINCVERIGGDDRRGSATLEHYREVSDHGKEKRRPSLGATAIEGAKRKMQDAT